MDTIGSPDAAKRSMLQVQASSDDSTTASGALGSPLSANSSASSTSSSVVAHGVSDSEQQMWEEQVRVLAASVAELQALIHQRGRHTVAPSASSEQTARTQTATLQYANLSSDQAHSLTSHLLLTSNTLISQLTEHWATKHRQRRPPAARCHEPSSLPLPKAESCFCQQTPAPSASPPGGIPHSPFPSSPSPSSFGAVRLRTVLPFSNIVAIEKNILAKPASTPAKLPQPSSAGLPFDQVTDARDTQVLQTHFQQLLARQPPLQSATHTPLSLLHPFGLGVHEFVVQFDHQARYVASCNTVVDRTFLQSQSAAIITFLSSHETLIVLAYPHLYQATLALKVLRSTLRSCVINDPLVVAPLARWYEQVYEEDDMNLAVRIDELAPVIDLAALGVPFPFNLVRASLLEAAVDASFDGSSGVGVGVAFEVDPDLDDSSDDDEAAHDQLIHSDEEEHGIMQPRPKRAASINGHPAASYDARRSNFAFHSPPPASSLRTTPSLLQIALDQQKPVVVAPQLSPSPAVENDAVSTDIEAPLPYARSIELLSTLDAVSTVDGKLEVLVQVCRMITCEFDEFILANGLNAAAETENTSTCCSDQEAQPAKSYTIACDELVQIVAFCFLHVRVQAPFATANLLSDYMDPVHLAGEFGYCLTTVQCAVEQLLHLDADLAQAQKQRFASDASSDAGQPPPTTSTSVSASPSQSHSSVSTYSASSSPAPFRSPSTLVSSASSLSGPSAEALQFAPILAANLAAFLQAADYTALDSQWQWLFEKDGITVCRKLYASSPCASIKGCGLIARPPHVLQAFLKNVNNRQAIDENYIGGRVLLHLDTTTKLVNYKFKARNWCARLATDIVLLLYQGVCSDGVTLVTLAFSVAHPSCPPQDGFDRTTVRSSGWLFKPTSNGAATHCTYIVSPDGNGFPAWLVNKLSQQQPMLIRDLRDHLYLHTVPEAAPGGPSHGMPRTPAGPPRGRTPSTASTAPPSPLLTPIAARRHSTQIVGTPPPRYLQ